MASAQDLAYVKFLSSINTQLQTYFAYIAPWIGLGFSTFAFLALALRKRRDKNLLIYIFLWQYIIGIIYPLNIAFNDNQFTLKLFGYTLQQYVSDPVCKLNYMFMRYIYCISPWMQVVLTFDRLWSVYLENKIRIKRTKKTVTILILSVLGFVLAADQVNMAYYLKNSKTVVSVFNQTLNKTVNVIINVATCNQPNNQLVLAQDMMYVIMRIILPFIIMVVCNVILISHIRQSRNRVVRGRKERKEQSFTKAVAIMNASFLLCNIGVVAYYILAYYLKFSGNKLDLVPTYINSLYGTCAILVSYCFSLSQFFVDIIFNKVFRKEMLLVFLIMTGRQNQVEETRQGNTNTHNSAAN